MITIEAVISDLDAISKGTGIYANLKTDTEKIIEAIKVVMKFLSTMRSNQLLPEDEKKRIHSEKVTKNKITVKK